MPVSSACLPSPQWLNTHRSLLGKRNRGHSLQCNSRAFIKSPLHASQGCCYSVQRFRDRGISEGYLLKDQMGRQGSVACQFKAMQKKKKKRWVIGYVWPCSQKTPDYLLDVSPTPRLVSVAMDPVHRALNACSCIHAHIFASLSNTFN